MITMQIPKMPEMWCSANSFIATVKDVCGALVKWAVRQSPYLVPDNLGEAAKQFADNFVVGLLPDDDEYFRTNCSALGRLVYQTFEKCPLIQAWNSPKVGNHTIAFVTRYSEPSPDYDFIDLDALARNVAHDLTMEAVVHKAQDSLSESKV